MRIPSCGIGGAPDWVARAAGLSVQVARLVVVAGALALVTASAVIAASSVRAADPALLHLPAGERP